MAGSTPEEGLCRGKTNGNPKKAGQESPCCRVLKVDADLFKRAEDKINVDLDILENLDTIPVDTFVPFVKKKEKTVSFYPLFSSGSRRKRQSSRLHKRVGHEQGLCAQGPDGHPDGFFQSKGPGRSWRTPRWRIPSRRAYLYDNARLLLTQAFDEKKVKKGGEEIAGDYVKMVTKFVKTLAGRRDQPGRHAHHRLFAFTPIA